MLEKGFPLRCIVQLSGRIECRREAGGGLHGVAWRDASNIREYGDAGAGCSIISTMLAHSGGRNQSGRGDGGWIAVVHRCRVERGPINQPQISMHGTFA